MFLPKIDVRIQLHSFVPMHFFNRKNITKNATKMTGLNSNGFKKACKKHAKNKQKWYIFSSLNGNLPFNFNMVHVCEWFKTMFENYCFFNYNSSFIEHILSGKYVSFCIFTTMYIRKIFIFFTKKHHFQQKNTRFRTTYQAKIRKQHVFLHIFFFARNARKFMIKIHGNTFLYVSF